MIQNQLPKRVYKTGRTVISWKEITEGFEVEVNEQTFTVVKNENVEKVSKTTGKAYKTRRLTVADVNGNELEVGADSFKKGSFIKRFNKLYPLVKAEPKAEVKKIVIDLGAKAEETEEERAFWESHIMTDSEQVDYKNRLYKLLTERGLLQAYSDYEYGKFVDKSTMEKLEKVFDIVDGIDDLDEESA